MTLEDQIAALEKRVAALEAKEQPPIEVTVAIDGQKFLDLVLNTTTHSTKDDTAAES